MNTLVDKLSLVVTMDAQAWHAYGLAAARIEDPQLRQQFARFQADHLTHVVQASALILKLGSVPPPFSKTFRGFTTQAFTGVCTARGTVATLRALQHCETLVHGTYDALTSLDLPEVAQDLAMRFHQHERLHLRFLVGAWDAANAGTAAMDKVG